MWITSSVAEVLKPNAIALGNFDGIHKGHQQVLLPIINQNSYATVVTFNPHPQEFFSGEKKKLLTPVQEKVNLLAELGIKQLVLLPFDQGLAALSPSEFVEKILFSQLQTSAISVGEDFRFGCQRAGNAEDLKAIAASYKIPVNITPKLTQADTRISSSLIRQALEKGEIELANQMLGRAYSLIGTVVKGEQIGRLIGFPTANLKLPLEKFLPKQGVYAVGVYLETEKEPVLGVMNIGCRPTVNGNSPTVEVHILDWQGDLYGVSLKVALKKYLRSEQKFSSLEALKTQIAADCQAARGV